MGFGVLWTVFPNRAVSQTNISYEQESVTNPTAIYSQPDPADVKAILLAAEVAKKVKIRAGDFCSCVTFVKGLTGIQKVVGAARNWPINSKIPTVGGVVVLNESNSGHVAYITAVGEDSFTVVEANYSPCRKTQRIISFENSDIKGFWSNN